MYNGIRIDEKDNDMIQNIKVMISWQQQMKVSICVFEKRSTLIRARSSSTAHHPLDI